MTAKDPYEEARRHLDDAIRTTLGGLTPKEQSELAAANDERVDWMHWTAEMQSDSASPLQFTLDGLEERRWDASAFGERWNGWAAPIVTREQARRFFTELTELEGAGDRHHFTEDGTLYVHSFDPDETIDLHPDGAGLYHLRDLGWTFLSSED
ncbi:hypothetical protein [Tsukamurella tyrosinosolvens]|uniref:hypothetical protein n=1 Tax=Tsukamurella tyrosinosolvens TaxID=57704 RepID=UPI000DF6A4DA|nr:hypothetical protein [Tsukamurella tyrosinosolvens]RDB47063.1 hypothetical protein DVB87_14910 [Tsukamurella tyrosinosolvens]